MSMPESKNVSRSAFSHDAAARWVSVVEPVRAEPNFGGRAGRRHWRWHPQSTTALIGVLACAGMAAAIAYLRPHYESAVSVPPMPLTNVGDIGAMTSVLPIPMPTRAVESAAPAPRIGEGSNSGTPSELAVSVPALGHVARAEGADVARSGARGPW